MDAHTDAHDEAPADAPDTAAGPDTSNGHDAHLGQQDIRTAKLAARRAAGETEPYRWPVDHSLADDPRRARRPRPRHASPTSGSASPAG